MLRIRLRYQLLQVLKIDPLTRRLVDGVQAEDFLRLLDLKQPAPLEGEEVNPCDDGRPDAHGSPA